jgi:hypothetical protein
VQRLRHVADWIRPGWIQRGSGVHATYSTRQAEAAPWRRRRANWRLHRQEGAAAAAAAAVVEYM